MTPARGVLAGWVGQSVARRVPRGDMTMMDNDDNTGGPNPIDAGTAIALAGHRAVHQLRLQDGAWYLKSGFVAGCPHHGGMLELSDGPLDAELWPASMAPRDAAWAVALLVGRGTVTVFDDGRCEGKADNGAPISSRIECARSTHPDHPAQGIWWMAECHLSGGLYNIRAPRPSMYSDVLAPEHLDAVLRAIPPAPGAPTIDRSIVIHDAVPEAWRVLIEREHAFARDEKPHEEVGVVEFKRPK